MIKKSPITGNYLCRRDLTRIQKGLRQAESNLIRGFTDSSEYCTYNKKLVRNWNMLIGANYPYNTRCGAKAESRFLRG